MDSKLKFLSDNVNGLKSSKKRIKMFKYFRDKISNNEIIFLQETHSTEDALTNSEMIFKDRHFFLMELRILVV